MQMRPPLSKMGTVPRSDSTSLSTIPAPVYRSDLDASTLPNDSRLRAIKTRDAPAQDILHPNQLYIRPLPQAPSDDILSRISHYQPHLTLALSDLSRSTSLISDSSPLPWILPCSFAFLATYAADSPDPHLQNFFQPATTSHYSANDIASAAAVTFQHLVTLTETGHRAWLQLGTSAAIPSASALALSPSAALTQPPSQPPSPPPSPVVRDSREDVIGRS